MEIRSMKDAEDVRELIGEQNFRAAKIALDDGARLWVFKSVEELEANEDLLEKEKEVCRQIFKEQNWAGFVRPPHRATPEPEPIPGIRHVPGMDSHGNVRGSVGGGGKDSIH